MSSSSFSVGQVQTSKILLAVLFLVAVLMAPFLLGNQRASAAACVSPSTDYGRATTSTTLPGTATYRVWTRMYTPNPTDNTYLLEVDGNTCITVGGSGVATGTWTWVSHQNGTLTSRIDLALSGGSHALKLIGNKQGVKIDRLVLTSDLACVPTGFGDNCNQPLDTTAPTVKVSSPAAGTSVSGSTVNVSATATDNIGISKVEFFVNGVLLASDTSSPYSATWDSSKLANGDQQLSARGYDAAGNTSSDSILVKVSNGDTIAPTSPSGVLAQATTYNKVHLSWSASSDNVGVTGYHLYRGGVPIATLGAVTSYDDTSVSASTSYSYKVEAFDAAGNRSALSVGASVTTPGTPVVDTQPPSQPLNLGATTVSENQINLSWSASTDNAGVIRYDIFRGTGTDVQKVGSSTSTSYGDTGLTSGSSYTYSVAAVDAAGNVSLRSSLVSATTIATPSENELSHSVTGTVKNSRSSRVSGVRIHVSNGDGTVSIVQSNKQGNYAIHNLKNGSYTFSAQKSGYATTQMTIIMNGADQIRNITLNKR